MPTAKVSAKGWVVIPKELRERAGIREGEMVHVIELGGLVALIPVARDPIAAARGMLAGGPSLAQALLRERKQEGEQEEAGLEPPGGS